MDRFQNLLSKFNLRRYIVVAFSIATTDTDSATTIAAAINAKSDVWPGRYCISLATS
jgi:hypothetical protein